MIHYRYWIGILLGMLVLVMSTLWSGNKEILSLVGFASAITSIILAVLAILLTTQSSSAVSNALSSITSSAARVEEAATRLDGSNVVLSSKLDEIPTALGEMAQRIDRAQETWGTHQNEVVEATEALSSTGAHDQGNSNIAKIIEGSPPGGVVAMYIAAKAFDKKRKFNPQQFMDSGADSFVRGYIRALGAMGIISLKYNKMTFEIGSIGNINLDDLNEILEKMLRKNPYVRKYKPKVDAYFDADDDL